VKPSSAKRVARNRQAVSWERRGRMKSRLLNNFLDFELGIPWFAVAFCLDRRVGFERGL
jgi:hypothetical protein